VNIIRTIASKTMRWAGHVARVYKVLSKSHTRTAHLEDAGVDGRRILELTLKAHDGKVCNGLTTAQDKDKKRDFVNTVMKLWVP
jgi:hypothetical protein